MHDGRALRFARALTGELAMALLWLVISIVGVAVRSVRDPLHRRPDRSLPTYWATPGASRAP